MEILFSKNRSDFDHFLKTYLFLLERGTYTSFELDKRQRTVLKCVYDTLVERRQDPLLFLSFCFSREGLITPVELKKKLLLFRSPYGLVYPIESFQNHVDVTIGALSSWNVTRLDYYKTQGVDVRLISLDPHIRSLVSLRSNPGFSPREWAKISTCVCLIGEAKITLSLLSDEWLPFLYGRRMNAVSV